MGPEPVFTARIESWNDVTSIVLSGDLDLATVPVLEEHLAKMKRDGVVAIVLDLRDLSLMDSTGVQAFLRARDHAKMKGQRLALVGASPPVRRLFELTGTTSLLDDQDMHGEKG